MIEGDILKKKGAINLTVATIIVASLGVFYLLIMRPIILDSAYAGVTALSTEMLKGKRTSCESQAEEFIPKGYDDLDEDGFPDFCDLCLGGDDKKDDDNDGRPDECDKKVKRKLLKDPEVEDASNNPSAFSCEFRVKDDDTRCVTDCSEDGKWPMDDKVRCEKVK